MQVAQPRHDRDYFAGRAIQDAASITPVAHDEAAEMGARELERFLELIRSLSPGDWPNPTACTLWNVREMVAHVAGAAASSADRSEAMRQNSPRVQRRYRKAGFSRLDAMNQIQVVDRAQIAPDRLIAELSEVGPRAVAVRKRIPAVVRAVRLPLGLVYPMGTIWVPIGYMSDVIMTRDMWMHRLDICRATNREMELSADHDGRITALVMRDLAGRLRRTARDESVIYELSGPAGGVWLIRNGGGEPAATIRIGTLDFHLLASGRMSEGDALSMVEIGGNADLGRRALAETSAVY